MTNLQTILSRITRLEQRHVAAVTREPIGSALSPTASTAAETEITAEFPIAGGTMPANGIATIEAWGAGTYTSGNNTWIQTHVFGGGQAQARYTSLPASFSWEVKAEVVWVDLGTTGHVRVMTRFLVSDQGAQANPSVIIATTPTGVAVDTTADTVMVLTCAGNGTFTIKGLAAKFWRASSP